jgi:hypothetical protein
VASRLDRHHAPLIELAEDLIERTELLDALHELIGKQGQLAPSVEHKADQGRRLEKSGWRSGGPPDVSEGARRHTRTMACDLLQHRHEPRECGVVFASFKGHESPLRHRATVASCRSGGHAIWWSVEATRAEEALRLLPAYVATRTTVSRVSEVEIP